MPRLASWQSTAALRQFAMESQPAQVSKDELRAAVVDLFNDGYSRKNVATKLMEDFNISSATAYRRIAEAMPDMDYDLADTYKVADLAIGALARQLMRAEDEDRVADIERLACSLAKVASQLKQNHITIRE